jgi:hypothetical protein
MTYRLQELVGGPRWRVVRGGFVRRSQGEAFARDWLAANGYALVMLEHDGENDAIDIMTAKGDALRQFAVEPESDRAAQRPAKP